MPAIVVRVVKRIRLNRDSGIPVSYITKIRRCADAYATQTRRVVRPSSNVRFWKIAYFAIVSNRVNVFVIWGHVLISLKRRDFAVLVLILADILLAVQIDQSDEHLVRGKIDAICKRCEFVSRKARDA